MKMQQIQCVENSHFEAIKNLVKSSPVKEDEKLHLEFSRNNASAMDMLGLTWIFLEEDF